MDIITLIGWNAIVIVAFIAGCIFIGLISIEIKKWAIYLYCYGKKLRKRFSRNKNGNKN